MSRCAFKRHEYCSIFTAKGLALQKVKGATGMYSIVCIYFFSFFLNKKKLVFSYFFTTFLKMNTATKNERVHPKQSNVHYNFFSEKNRPDGM